MTQQCNVKYKIHKISNENSVLVAGSGNKNPSFLKVSLTESMMSGVFDLDILFSEKEKYLVDRKKRKTRLPL